MENLKKSWKYSWKVMEFEEVKRVRTLRAPCRNIPQKENEEARGSFCLDPSVIYYGWLEVSFNLLNLFSVV